MKKLNQPVWKKTYKKREITNWLQTSDGWISNILSYIFNVQRSRLLKKRWSLKIFLFNSKHATYILTYFQLKVEQLKMKEPVIFHMLVLLPQ